MLAILLALGTLLAMDDSGFVMAGRVRTFTTAWHGWPRLSQVEQAAIRTRGRCFTSVGARLVARTAQDGP